MTVQDIINLKSKRMKNAKQILDMIDGIMDEDGILSMQEVQEVREEIWRLSEGTKQMHNGEWLEHVCDFIPIAGPFLLQAMRDFIIAVIKQQDAIRKEWTKDGRVPFIDPELWIKTAYDLKKAYEEKYENTIDVGDAPANFKLMEIVKVSKSNVSVLAQRDTSINTIVSRKIQAWEADGSEPPTDADELLEDFREQAVQELGNV